MPYLTLAIDNAPQRRIATRRDLVEEPIIMIVEDDAGTRQFICTVLRYATNAHLIEASDPDCASMKARALGRPVDLLIADINLGAARTGIDLARELATDNPSLKVLLMSGVDSRPSDIPRAWRFLAKPFPIEIFLRYVEEMCSSAKLTRAAATSVKDESAA